MRVKVSLFTVGVLLTNEISGRITTREKDRILSCPNNSSIILKIICSVTNLDKSSSHFSDQRFYVSVYLMLNHLQLLVLRPWTLDGSSKFADIGIYSCCISINHAMSCLIMC